jgi:uncharacterized protein
MLNGDNILVSPQGEKYHEAVVVRSNEETKSPTATDAVKTDPTQGDDLEKGHNKTSSGENPNVQKNSQNQWLTTAGQLFTALCMGLLFGAAMERGKVTPPITIRKQFLFRRFIMFKMFLSAAAFGAICFAFLSLVFPSAFEPVRGKFMSSRAGKGLVPVVIGTFLLGCGMAIAGACPGMVYIQLGAGIENAIITLLGGFTAAMVYGLVQPFITSFLSIGCTQTHKVDDISMLKGFKYWHFVPPLVAFMVIAIALFEHYFPWDSASELGAIGNSTYTPWSQAWAPELSGVLIGSLQLPAVMIAHGTVGSSSTYMTIVAQILFTTSLQDRFKHMDGFRTGASMWNSVVYIWSAALGAYIAAQAGGTFKSSRGVQPGPAFIGGFLMLFGSRCAWPHDLLSYLLLSLIFCLLLCPCLKMYAVGSR